jgi:dipeptidyl aminopeptidase/acylaminoacyl peptidase
VQELPQLPLGQTTPVQWKSTDSREIEGLLTLPVGYKTGERIPLLVVVHGGPTGVFVQNCIVARGPYPIPVFASKGYAVLRCNIRGSSGYGKEFRYANYNDWGGGDYRDIISGVDALIEQGIADPDRLGVMGWSYGGYMTSWTITQTKRFKAASVGAGVTNLMSFTGTADINDFIPDYMGGEYWEQFDRWQARSAMFHVKGVTTPTLIQHGDKDVRVPISQGYELYNALRRQGVLVKMVVYPRQPHGLQEPKMQLDAMHQNVAWFDQHLAKNGKP